ncbi:MAG: signal peptidase I [Rickettsiales bacterium]|nr:MAG: signal peptidase I [Rickettsiales bacterium]
MLTIEKTDKPHGAVKSEVLSLVLVIILALAVRTFIFELFYVPTGSMRATILEGDYIFSTKYNYGYSIYSIPFNPDLFEGRAMASQPEYGDIVIMRPPHNMEERYIKRLIGLPGDKIEIVNDLTYINDKPVTRLEVGQFVSEDEIKYIKFRETLPNGLSFFSYKLKYSTKELGADQRNYGPHIVEAGHYFFMGDNRDNSGDSRYQLGMVPFRNLIAKGRFIFFSTKESLWDSKAGFVEQITRVWTWLSSIRFNRIFYKLYEPKSDSGNGK